MFQTFADFHLFGGGRVGARIKFKIKKLQKELPFMGEY